MKVNMKNDDGTVFEIAGDFQNLKATYKKADGDIIMDFSGTFEEFEKFQKMTQQPEETTPKTEEHEEDIHLTVEENSSPKPIHKSEDELEVGKYFIVNEDGARLSQYDAGEIVIIVDDKGRFIHLENSLGVDQILKLAHLDSVTTLYGPSVAPEKAQETIEQYFNLAKDVGISLNKTKGFQDQELYHPDFGKVVGYDNDLYLLWVRKEDDELDFDEAKEFSKFIKKDKFIPEEETLYYLKESVTDSDGDTVNPGLVTFAYSIFDKCLIKQYEKPLVFAPSDIGDKVFKVRRRDIVKVVADTGTDNNVVGETGLLLYEEYGFEKLVQEEPILRPYVAQDEIRQVSDEEAQKFFERQIELSNL